MVWRAGSSCSAVGMERLMVSGSSQRWCCSALCWMLQGDGHIWLGKSKPQNLEVLGVLKLHMSPTTMRSSYTIGINKRQSKQKEPVTSWAVCPRHLRGKSGNGNPEHLLSQQVLTDSLLPQEEEGTPPRSQGGDMGRAHFSCLLRGVPPNSRGVEGPMPFFPRTIGQKEAAPGLWTSPQETPVLREPPVSPPSVSLVHFQVSYQSSQRGKCKFIESIFDTLTEMLLERTFNLSSSSKRKASCLPWL